MKTTVFTLLLLFFLYGLQAQSCTVRVDSLQGKYSGECKKGKADGMGTAIGVDTFTGSFKNGFPDGAGKYTWHNGDWYNGQWKNGVFEGRGTLYKKDALHPDSLIIISGYWKKGQYTGAYEKPYTITALTNNFNDINFRKLNNTKTEFSIIVKSITSGASTLGDVHLPKPRLTGIQPLLGRFEQQVSDESSSLMHNQYTFRKVSFPFHAIFSFETAGKGENLHTEKIEVEIMEMGNWYLQLSIDN